MRQKSLPLQQISITNMKQLSSEKVSLGEKLGYSLGDAAANLVFQMMMIFQLKFYTDVFGLDGAVAGSVLMIASISAIIVDPTVGILTDRTSTRWGKFRPWVLWTAIPFCLFYVLAFYNPGIEDKGMVATYATISYVLLMTVYSFNNVPYTSLGGVMTSVIREPHQHHNYPIRCSNHCPVYCPGVDFTIGKPILKRQYTSAWLDMHYRAFCLCGLYFLHHYFPCYKRAHPTTP